MANLTEITESLGITINLEQRKEQSLPEKNSMIIGHKRRTWFNKTEKDFINHQANTVKVQPASSAAPPRGTVGGITLGIDECCGESGGSRGRGCLRAGVRARLGAFTSCILPAFLMSVGTFAVRFACSFLPCATEKNAVLTDSEHLTGARARPGAGGLGFKIAGILTWWRIARSGG